MALPRTRLRIVVAGTFATAPGHGGNAWAILQYVLGLRRLGHRVTFLDVVRLSALQPARATPSESTNAAYFTDVVRQFGLEKDSALLLAGSERSTIGLSYRQIIDATRDADLLLNISGVLQDASVLSCAPRRVYIDLDPAFTQLWHATQGIDMGFGNHSDFVTIGRAIGTPECDVPTCGLRWIPTWQPVTLEHWPCVNGDGAGSISTVANWRSYGSVEHEGRFYGQKVHAWRQLMALPTRTAEPIVVALAIDPGETADLKALADNGWRLADPARVCATPDAYRRFVQESKAELGIAKLGYVISGTGWLSDRSVCYLASGRPVLAQETGFSRFIPSGEGLLPFETVDDVLDGIAQLNADYPKHARAARALADEYFDSDKVLTRLLDRLGAANPSAASVASEARG